MALAVPRILRDPQPFLDANSADPSAEEDAQWGVAPPSTPSPPLPAAFADDALANAQGDGSPTRAQAAPEGAAAGLPIDRVEAALRGAGPRLTAGLSDEEIHRIAQARLDKEKGDADKAISHIETAATPGALITGLPPIDLLLGNYSTVAGAAAKSVGAPEVVQKAAEIAPFFLGGVLGAGKKAAEEALAGGATEAEAELAAKAARARALKVAAVGTTTSVGGGEVGKTIAEGVGASPTAGEMIGQFAGGTPFVVERATNAVSRRGRVAHISGGEPPPESRPESPPEDLTLNGQTPEEPAAKPLPGQTGLFGETVDESGTVKPAATFSSDPTRQEQGTQSNMLGEPVQPGLGADVGAPPTVTSRLLEMARQEKDPATANDMLQRAATRGATDAELNEILDRLDPENVGLDASRPAWNVAHIGEASAETKARAMALYEKIHADIDASLAEDAADIREQLRRSVSMSNPRVQTSEGSFRIVPEPIDRTLPGAVQGYFVKGAPRQEGSISVPGREIRAPEGETWSIDDAISHTPGVEKPPTETPPAVTPPASEGWLDGMGTAIADNYVARILSDLEQGITHGNMAIAEQFADYAYRRGYKTAEEVKAALKAGQKAADEGVTGDALVKRFNEEFPEKPPEAPAVTPASEEAAAAAPTEKAVESGMADANPPAINTNRMTVKASDLSYRPDLFQTRDADVGKPYAEARVKQLVDNWDPSLFTPPTVVLDPETGKYIVTAGQHRTEAFRRVYGDDASLEVNVAPHDIHDPAQLARAQLEADASNTTTKALNIREEIRNLQRADAAGQDQGQLETLLGKNGSYIEKLRNIAAVGTQAIDRVVQEPALIDLASEVGRGMKLYGVTTEDANGLFNRWANAAKGQRPTTTAARETIDKFGKAMAETSQNALFDLGQFEGMGRGGLLGAIDENARIRSQLTSALRSVRSAQNKATALAKLPNATAEDAAAAERLVKLGKDEEERLRGELALNEADVARALRGDFSPRSAAPPPPPPPTEPPTGPTAEPEPDYNLPTPEELIARYEERYPKATIEEPGATTPETPTAKVEEPTAAKGEQPSLIPDAEPVAAAGDSGPPAPPSPPARGGGTAPPPPPPTPPTAGVPEPSPEAAAARTTLRDLFGVQTPEPRLTLYQRALNALRSVMPQEVVNVMGAADEGLASSTFRMVREGRQRIEAQSNRFGAVMAQLIKEGGFKLDDKGRITDLPGNPTIQDVAAKLPQYEDLLSVRQNLALAEMRREIQPFAQALKEQGVEFGSRADVEPGGFYLPRGRADVEGADEVRALGGPRRLGSKKGFERSASFESMAQGIENGFEYATFGDAMQAYARDAGNRSLDAFAADYLKNAVDEAGNKIAKTSAVPEPVRIRLEDARDAATRAQRAVDSIQRALRGERLPAGTIQAINDQFPQLKGDLRASSRFTIDDLIEAGNRAETDGRVALPPVHIGTIRTLDKAVEEAGAAYVAEPTARNRAELNRLKRQAGFARFRFSQEQATREASGMTFGDMMDNPESWTVLEKSPTTLLLGDRKEALQDMLTQIRGEPYDAKNANGQKVVRYRGGLVDDIREELQGAQANMNDERARGALPRGRGAIQNFTGLQGYNFPETVANAATKYIDQMQPPSGATSGISKGIQAANNLLRGLRATADVSFMGIQGLLGAGHDPQAYGEALVTAMKAMGDRDALGAYFRDFDKNAIAKGLPTSADWAAAGTRVGGRDYELSVGRSIGGLMKSLPVVSQADRSFGYFGDTLRTAMSQDIFEARGGIKLAGAERLDLMREIAEGTNLMTGWSKGRFGGDLGGLMQFAPRFFQSQLELIGRAATDGSITGQEARKAILKLVAYGSIVTVGANTALGNNKDNGFDYLSPLDKNGHFNSNFMRIRVAGNDVSIFGPWDSLARGVATAPSDGGAYLLRTKASPLLATAVDLITGKDFQGRDVGGGEVAGIHTGDAEYWARSLLPFSASGAANQNLVGTAIGLAGVKSSPLSPTEQRDQLARKMFEGRGFDQLLPSEQDKVKKTPEVQAAVQQSPEVQRLHESQKYINDLQGAEEEKFKNGTLPQKIGDDYHDFGQRRQQLSHDFDTFYAEQIAKYPVKDLQRVTEPYYAISKNDAQGNFDYDATQAARQDYLDKLSDKPRPDGGPSDKAVMADYLKWIEGNKTDLQQKRDTFIQAKKAAGYFADKADAGALDKANPTLDVQGWYFNGGLADKSKDPALQTIGAADQALQMLKDEGLKNRNVKLAGLTRPINQSQQTEQAWSESKDWIDFFQNSDAVKNLQNADALKTYKKPFDQLGDSEKQSVKGKVSSQLQTSSPELDAWLAYWGYGISNNEIVLNSKAAVAALNQIQQKYGDSDAKDGIVYKLAKTAR